MKEFLFFKAGKDYFKLRLSEILFIQAEKKHTHFVTATKSYATAYSIGYIEKLLPQNLFCRVHRSYIISLLHTERFNNELAYIDKKKIPIGREYKNLLKNAVLMLSCEEKPITLDDGDVNKLLENIDL